MIFEFQFDALGPLAQQLRGLTGERLGASAVEVVNRVTTAFDREQRAGQIADINLARSYVDDKTKTVLANSPANPRATITTKGDLTVMDRFGAQSYKRPGDRDKRGRRLGQRQGGVLLPIKRSSPQREDSMFMLPLRNSPGRMGVFVRTTASGGKPVHKYGPSPYALFRFQIRTREDQLLDDLQRQAVAEFGDTIERALK